MSDDSINMSEINKVFDQRLGDEMKNKIKIERLPKLKLKNSTKGSQLITHLSQSVIGNQDLTYSDRRNERDDPL